MTAQRLAVTTALCLAVIWTTSVVAQTREEAVLQAREGHTEEAIAALRALLEKNPNDSAVGFDLAVILTWASRPREATEAFEHAATSAEPPEYVLGPMIR